MSRPSNQHGELVHLLAALRDEQITAEQFARLQQLLSKDAEARRFYVRFMTLHASLEQVGSVEVNRILFTLWRTNVYGCGSTADS